MVLVLGSGFPGGPEPRYVKSGGLPQHLKLIELLKSGFGTPRNTPPQDLNINIMSRNSTI